MKFSFRHILWRSLELVTDKPSWMESWVWDYHVTKLEVGQMFSTDFHDITRIE